MASEGAPVDREDMDVVVVGGGVAGCVAAIAAGRSGLRTALIHNRPVLGGPSSVECSPNADGSFVNGASEYANVNARECGIIDEMKTEARWRKSVGYDQHWSLVLREWVEREPRVRLFLNTEAHTVRMDGSRIRSVLARTLNSEREWEFAAPLYIDCTGDGFVGAAAGAEYRQGREGRDEFGESLAPEQPDRKTMGSSIGFRAVDTGRPVPFEPPPWAMRFPSEDDLPFRPHSNPRQGYWWLEYGGELDTIRDNEAIYGKLLSILYGVWDHVKNHGDHGAENYVINWVSSIAAKRESRRLMGDYILTQNDVTGHPTFPDAVAYGGWPIDLHPPEGFFSAGHPGSPPPFVFPGVYPIPFRCLYSKDVDNLMMAGRNISVTHVALGTTRVMATCALLGQAAGTAAAVALERGATPRQVATDHIAELKARLYQDDAGLPGEAIPWPENLAARARPSAQSALRLDKPGSVTGAIPLVAPPKSGGDPADVPPADRRRAQMFPVAGDRVESVTLLFDNLGGTPAFVEASLHEALGPGDFTPTPALATARQEVPFGQARPVVFAFSAEVSPGKPHYVLLSATPGVEVCLAERYLPGLCPKPDGCYLSDANLALGVSPPQEIFGPKNAVNGHVRAGAWPNMWISDPADGLPQSLTLEFDRPARVGAVEVIFDTNLNTTPKAGASPECARTYRVAARVGREWRDVAEVDDNRFRRRRHAFAPLDATALRLTVTATHGDPSARVYELRAFGGQNE